MCYHETFAIPYVAIVAGFYGLDRVLRLVQTRIVTAQLRPIPELGMTRIEVPSVNAGWRAGQHVRVRVLSSGMGVFGWMESHPFTIASVSKVRSSPHMQPPLQSAYRVVIHLMFAALQRRRPCSHGKEGWRLDCQAVRRCPAHGVPRSGWADAEHQGHAQRTVRCVCLGTNPSLGSIVADLLIPLLGGPGHAIVNSFSGAMLVAGGSGITYALSTVQELITKSAEMVVHLSHAAQGKEEEDIHASERNASPTVVGLHVRRHASFIGPFGD